MKKSYLLLCTLLFLTSCLHKNLNSQSKKNAQNDNFVPKTNILTIPTTITLAKPVDSRVVADDNRSASNIPLLSIEEKQTIQEYIK